MIVGEPQILGQVKEAVQIARDHGFLNTQLAGLLEKALFVAKKGQQSRSAMQPSNWPERSLANSRTRRFSFWAQER
jgi:hypothetical protein